MSAQATAARWITRERVMELTGWSRARVKDTANAEDLGRVDGPKGPNGKPTPLYDAHRLPPEAQESWLRNKVVEIRERDPAEAVFELRGADPDCERLEGEDLRIANERLAAIRPAIGAKRADRRKILMRQAAAVGVGERTIYRWWQRYEGKTYKGRRGLEALADRDRKDKGASRRINAAARELVVALMTPKFGEYGDLGTLTTRQGYEEYKAERRWRAAKTGKPIEDPDDRERLMPWLDSGFRLTAEGVPPAVCYTTFRNWWNDVPTPYKTLARKGPDAHDKQHALVIRRDYAGMSPMEYVVMDHRQLDVYAILPPEKRGGEPRLGRPWITAAIDMRTRKWLGWAIVPNPNSESIVSVVKHVLVEHGRPQNLYWDNGQDFESKWVAGIVEALGTKVIHALPENARAKMIEPNFLRISQADRLSTGWVGHKASARPEAVDGEMRLAWARYADGKTGERPFKFLAELREIYQDLLTDLNERRLDGEGMHYPDAMGRLRPTAPNVVWDRLIVGVVREQVPVKALHTLFLEERQATVRNGQIRVMIQGRTLYYGASSADGFDSGLLVHYDREKVFVRLDRYDLETVVLYRQSDNKLICVARQPELRGMGEQDFKADMQAQRRTKRTYRELVEGVRRKRIVDPVDRIRRRVAERDRVEPERPTVDVLLPTAAAASGGFGGAVKPVAVQRQTTPDDDERFDFFDNA